MADLTLAPPARIELTTNPSEADCGTCRTCCYRSRAARCLGYISAVVTCTATCLDYPVGNCRNGEISDDRNGKIVPNAAGITIGEEYDIIMSDGSFSAEVTGVDLN